MDNGITVLEKLKNTDVLTNSILNKKLFVMPSNSCTGSSEFINNNFIESELYPAPSYKFSESGPYKLTKDENNKKSVRLAGYADRIFKSNENSESIINQVPNSYECHYYISGSDHKPVSQKYQINIPNQIFSVFCLTWNIAELDLYTVNDKLNTQFIKQKDSDILVFCFQEVNHTDHKNILFRSSEFSKYTLITEEYTDSGFKLLICILYKKNVVGDCISDEFIKISNFVSKKQKQKLFPKRIVGGNILKNLKMVKGITSEIKKQENNLLYLNFFKCQRELFKGARFIKCTFDKFSFVVCNVHLPFKSESKTLKSMLLVNERINLIRKFIFGSYSNFTGFITMGDFNSRSTFVPEPLNHIVVYDKSEQKRIPLENILDLELQLNRIIYKRRLTLGGLYKKKLKKKSKKIKKKN